jgi:GNAT superfamily N-acetyltransferase
MSKVTSQALAAILADAASGRFPASDGRTTILPQPSARDAGVIAFTGHSVIFADADPAWVAGQLPADDPFAAPLRPEFLSALARRMGRIAHHCDMLTCATALPGAPATELTPDADPAHPRISRALRYRDEVRTWLGPGGVVTVGRGIAGRWEVAIEVDEEARGAGLGRALATAARHLVPGGAPLWAQIAPGNAASVRAFLAAGFRPVGAECHLTLP